MGFLERAIRRGVSNAVGKAIGKAIEPTVTDLTNNPGKLRKRLCFHSNHHIHTENNAGTD